MSRAGRKRKFAQREPNGRIRRPSLQALKELEHSKRIEQMATVLAQPHRRGDTRQECATALGRFWISLDTADRTLLHAGEAYAGLVRRWRAAWGRLEAAVPPEGVATGVGPSEKTVRAWRAEIERIENRLSQVSHQVRFITNRLVLDDRDIAGRQDGFDAQIGLRVIALEMGMCKPDHPFR